MPEINEPFIIGIGGPTCSGKTSLAKQLSAKLRPVGITVLTIDSYYKDLTGIPMEARQKINFDHPSAIEWNLLLNHLDRLKQNKSIEMPIYDFETHTRLSQKSKILSENIIIIEGIFAFSNQSLMESYDFRVYIDLDDETALNRRIARDMKERDRTEQSIRRQFYDQVLPMQEQFIFSGKNLADLIVSGSDQIENSCRRIIEKVRLILNFPK